MPIRRSPNDARHPRPQGGRDHQEQVVAINRNDWSQAIGTPGRDHPVRANTSRDVFGDSAYRSAAAEARLKAQRFRSRIHVRATRGHPLSKAKTAANRAKSRIRARIEHVFGTQETAPGGRLVRTIGIIRARAKIGLQNFVYNIRRLATLERMAAAYLRPPRPKTTANLTASQIFQLGLSDDWR